MMERERLTNKIKSSLLQPASLITSLLAWQILSDFSAINEHILPAPLEIVKSLARGILSGQLLNDSYRSVIRVLIGFSLGGTAGTCLGLLCGLNNATGLVLRPILEILRPIPPIAWIPISILWFGYGEPSAIFLVSLGAFFPLFSSTVLGISQTRPGTIDFARCYDVSRSIILRRIIIPQALPSIFTGVKTGLGVSWMIVITAELVGVQSGLGYFIQLSRAQLQLPDVLAGMIVIGLIGLLFNFIVKVISAFVMPWKNIISGVGYGA